MYIVVSTLIGWICKSFLGVLLPRYYVILVKNCTSVFYFSLMIVLYFYCWLGWLLLVNRLSLSKCIIHTLFWFEH